VYSLASEYFLALVSDPGKLDLDEMGSRGKLGEGGKLSNRGE
jgi:hypothetical protein